MPHSPEPLGTMYPRRDLELPSSTDWVVFLEQQTEVDVRLLREAVLEGRAPTDKGRN